MEESGNLERTVAAGTSPAQVAANRANALLSTGPKTEQGKYRSRLNATTHGLTGRIIILTGEELSKYQTLHREFAEFYKPVGPEENGLVRTIADCQWRLDRSMPIEQGLEADAHQGSAGDFDCSAETEHYAEVHATITAARAFRDEAEAVSKLSLYLTRIGNLLARTRKQLLDIQAIRKAHEQTRLEEALLLARCHQIQSPDLLYDPATDGFDFSAQFLQNELTRRERLDSARATLKAAAKPISLPWTAKKLHA